jgi:hypothetical protein
MNKLTSMLMDMALCTGIAVALAWWLIEWAIQ